MNLYILANHRIKHFLNSNMNWLRAVGGLLVRSHPGWVEVSLCRTPKPPIAPDELVGTLHGSQSPLVCEWVNEQPQLCSALDKGAI